MKNSLEMHHRLFGIVGGVIAFVIAPKKAEEIIAEIGEAKPEYESVAAHHPIIFWSAPIKTFSRTRYSKIVGTKTYQSVTIRNASTTRKLAELCQR